MQPRLVPVVVLGPVLHRQPHLPPRPGRRLQGGRCLVVGGAPQVHVVHRHDLEERGGGMARIMPPFLVLIRLDHPVALICSCQINTMLNMVVNGYTGPQ